MRTPLFHVDAFTDRPFAGNPAGVCLLGEDREGVWMQNIAREMNLPETAFLRRREGHWDLRWFTPSVEVDLCGHATLASAHVLWESGHAKPGNSWCSRRAAAGLPPRNGTARSSSISRPSWPLRRRRRWTCSRRLESPPRALSAAIAWTI